MPKKLRLPLEKFAVDEEVHKWFDCLARGDYKAAYDLTFHDPYYKWTPGLMENIINGYGWQYENGETKYKVTDWRSALGKDREGEVNLYANHIEGGGGYTQIGHAYYEIPLNGEWSDLSVVFRLVKHEDGMALLLEEIHVL